MSDQESIPDEDKALAEKHKHIGNTKMLAGRYEQAIDSFTKSASLNPYHAVYFSMRAAANSAAGHHLQAVEDAKHAIRVDSKFVKAYRRLGDAYCLLGDMPGAISAFRQGLELDPGNLTLKHCLKHAQSIEDYLDVISIDTHHGGNESS